MEMAHGGTIDQPVADEFFGEHPPVTTWQEAGVPRRAPSGRLPTDEDFRYVGRVDTSQELELLEVALEHQVVLSRRFEMEALRFRRALNEMSKKLDAVGGVLVEVDSELEKLRAENESLKAALS